MRNLQFPFAFHGRDLGLPKAPPGALETSRFKRLFRAALQTAPICSLPVRLYPSLADVSRSVTQLVPQPKFLLINRVPGVPVDPLEKDPMAANRARRAVEAKPPVLQKEKPSMKSVRLSRSALPRERSRCRGLKWGPDNDKSRQSFRNRHRLRAVLRGLTS
jgi:hypothetical protein